MTMELIMTVPVAAYVAVAALGHALLLAAICRCLREDHFGGRRRRAVTDAPAIADNGARLLPAQ
jgi:hypothetical protein